MKKNLWKIVGGFAAILSAGTITAGCQTSETVTVAAGPSGSAVIVEECATESCAQAQQAKNAMQPATAAKASQAACKTACTDKDGKTGKVPSNVQALHKLGIHIGQRALRREPIKLFLCKKLVLAHFASFKE